MEFAAGTRETLSLPPTPGARRQSRPLELGAARRYRPQLKPRVTARVPREEERTRIGSALAARTIVLISHPAAETFVSGWEGCCAVAL